MFSSRYSRSSEFLWSPEYFTGSLLFKSPALFRISHNTYAFQGTYAESLCSLEHQQPGSLSEDFTQNGKHCLAEPQFLPFTSDNQLLRRAQDMLQYSQRLGKTIWAFSTLCASSSSAIVVTPSWEISWWRFWNHIHLARQSLWMVLQRLKLLVGKRSCHLWKMRRWFAVRLPSFTWKLCFYSNQLEAHVLPYFRPSHLPLYWLHSWTSMRPRHPYTKWDFHEILSKICDQTPAIDPLCTCSGSFSSSTQSGCEKKNENLSGMLAILVEREE